MKIFVRSVYVLSRWNIRHLEIFMLLVPNQLNNGSIIRAGVIL